jgi:hypothetical protein
MRIIRTLVQVFYTGDKRLRQATTWYDPQPRESQLVDKFRDLVDTSAPSPPQKLFAGTPASISRDHHSGRNASFECHFLVEKSWPCTSV